MLQEIMLLSDSSTRVCMILSNDYLDIVKFDIMLFIVILYFTYV
jgi:hypothetical protein